MSEKVENALTEMANEMTNVLKIVHRAQRVMIVGFIVLSVVCGLNILV